jgi:hypothetical protein
MKMVEAYKYRKKDDFITVLRQAETDFYAKYQKNACYLYGNSFIMSRITDFLNSSDAEDIMARSFYSPKDFTEAFEDGQIPENLVPVRDEESGFWNAIDTETGDEYDYSCLMLNAGKITCGLAEEYDEIDLATKKEIAYNSKKAIVYDIQSVNKNSNIYLVRDDSLPDNRFILKYKLDLAQMLTVEERYKCLKSADIIMTVQKAEMAFCDKYELYADSLYANNFVMSRIAKYLATGNVAEIQYKHFSIVKDFNEAFEDGQIPENLVPVRNEVTGRMDALDKETGNVYDYTDVMLAAGRISCGLSYLDNPESTLETVNNSDAVLIYALQTINEDKGLFLVVDDTLPDNQFILRYNGQFGDKNLCIFQKRAKGE